MMLAHARPHRRLHLLGRREVRLLHAQQRLHVVARVERQLLGHHPVQHRTDREDVGAPIDGLPQRLLGRHVRDLALDDAGGGLLAIALRLRDPEVGQLDLALIADQHVVRADVAVDDAQRLAVARLGVRVGQRAADAGGDVQAERGRPDDARRVRALQDFLEIPAVDQLQRQEVAAAGDAQVQHLGDVAVLEAHRDVRLVEHHVAELRIGRIRRQDPLEDDRLLEPLGAVLDRQENLGHAAVGELAQDGVAAV